MNNNTIKFRAWNHTINKMEYFDINSFVGRSVYHSGYWWNIEGEPVDRTDLDDLEMFSGAHDKNNKEVYVNDIYKQPENNSLVDGEVKGWAICTIVFTDEHCFRAREGLHIFYWIKFTGEVIGNTHETPKLIKVANDGE